LLPLAKFFQGLAFSFTDRLLDNIQMAGLQTAKANACKEGSHNFKFMICGFRYVQFWCSLKTSPWVMTVFVQNLRSVTYKGKRQEWVAGRLIPRM
jgi:hypothetical protein